MVMIEPELRCPAPRPTRLRPVARRRFVFLLGFFLILGAAPLVDVARQIWAFQMLQHDGQPVEATVQRRGERRIAGVWVGTLECLYAGASGRMESASVQVNRTWWAASPPGSKLTITACASTPGYAAQGDPSTMQLTTELGLLGYSRLLFGLAALVVLGCRIRPYFRDLTLVSLGTPVTGRVVGKSWKMVRRWGRKRALPMIHLHFRDPFGVERVRTQIVGGNTWAHVAEGESMTVLVCSQRRGWFAAYPLLLAEALPPRAAAPVALGSERA